MISYKNLDDSLNFYNNLGYVRIETPWLVPECIDNITKPKDKKSYKLEHNQKCLVASGEQSFLYLYLKDFLPKGKFQTITPCFRDERYDMIHGKYFMKNELIITDETNSLTLAKIVDDALKFFKTKIVSNLLDVVETKEGFDIVYINGDNEIELGSYGIRECEFIKWVYGTGCPEPRLSNLTNNYYGNM